MANPSLEEFLQGHARNAWVRFRHGEFYLRRMSRRLEGAARETLDIANVNLPAKWQGKGVFTALVQHIAASIAPDHYLFVENVLEERFRDHLRRSGWTEVEQSGSIAGWPPSFYKQVLNARVY